MHDTNDFFYGFLNILYPEACMNEWENINFFRKSETMIITYT